MKVINKYNVNVTRAVILLLENKITNKEFQKIVSQKTK